jgi:hypothetical protein
MCVAACYQINGKIVITNFAQVGAALPVTKTAHSIITMPWGRRKNENGALPLGGWIAQEFMLQGKWDKYFPKAVKIPLIKFQENDYEGQSVWFDVTPGQWVQGLLLQEKEEQRVYVVTLTPLLPHSTFSRWPSIFCD